MRTHSLSLALLAALAATASAQTTAHRTALPQTRPERTDYAETSRYDDVMAFVRALPHSPRMHLTSMGYTGEGRDIPLMVVGNVPNATPEAVKRSGKLRIYIQANIHAGEVEGKEAAQVLLRDLATGKHARWLDSVVLLVAPIYNADGNERVSLTNRPLQLGPIGGEGQRPNAAGLDLNRDHMKLESAEARSQVMMLRAYDPQVMMDLHTTDGSVHGYYLTYAEPLHPNTDAGIIQFLRGELLPAVTQRIKQTDDMDLYYYGNFPGREGEQPGAERGWYTFEHRPRFSNNYWGLRNRVGILSEAYSYATFQDRIKATLRFVEETVTYAAAHASQIRGITEAADAHRIIGESLAVRARMHHGADAPILRGETADSINPFTGQRMLRRLDVRRPEMMPDYTTFEGSEYERVPRAYYVPANLAAVIERLNLHGVMTTRLAQQEVVTGQRYRIDSTWTAAREFQGHRERQARGAWESSTDTLPAGTVVVAMDQPLARLVFILLEPRSDDGVLDWNLMERDVEGARYYPIRRTLAGN
jgi:hypothetical protein